MQTSNKEDSNLRSFLNYLLVDKGLSNNTVKAYEADISSFFQWLDNEDLKYKNLQEDHINQYISFLFQKKMRSSSVNRKISSIKSFYIFLVKRNFVKNFLILIFRNLNKFFTTEHGPSGGDEINLLNLNLNNFNLKNTKFSSENIFNFEITNKFKLNNLKIDSDINFKKVIYNNNLIPNYFSNQNSEILLDNHKLKLIYEKVDDYNKRKLDTDLMTEVLRIQSLVEEI